MFHLSAELLGAPPRGARLKALLGSKRFELYSRKCSGLFALRTSTGDRLWLL